MSETWYVLENGDAVDPSEVAPDKSGVLRHKGGAAVAMRGQVPSTRGVDPDEEAAKKVKPKVSHDERPAAKTKEAESKSVRQMKADDDEGGKYKTR